MGTNIIKKTNINIVDINTTTLREGTWVWTTLKVAKAFRSNRVNILSVSLRFEDFLIYHLEFQYVSKIQPSCYIDEVC